MTDRTNRRDPDVPGSEPGLPRRGVLAGLSAAVLLPLTRSSLRAQTAPPPHRLMIGTAEVTVLSDGAFSLPLGIMLPDRDPQAIEAVFRKQGLAFTGLHSEVNVALVRIGADLILIDTGGGADFVAGLGKLPDHLEAAGIKPESITKVIFTHAHGDHLWGVIDPLDGGTLFPKAEHMMAAVEFDFWMASDVANQVRDNFRVMAAGTNRRLKTLAARMRKIRPGEEIVPGVQIVGSEGHTPGHVSVLVKSGTEQLLIGGDALTQHVISFAEPDWRWGPDMDAAKAAATRRHLLDRLATDRVRLLGYHLPWPGIGHVERNGTAYRFVAA